MKEATINDIRAAIAPEAIKLGLMILMSGKTMTLQVVMDTCEQFFKEDPEGAVKLMAGMAVIDMNNIKLDVERNKARSEPPSRN